MGGGIFITGTDTGIGKTLVFFPVAGSNTGTNDGVPGGKGVPATWTVNMSNGGQLPVPSPPSPCGGLVPGTGLR